jgi:DNA replication and repair protein RecF
VELSHLSLTNFRSYRTLELDLRPGMTLVHGDNAEGKSNLLEAIYLLAIGKSYRASTERDLVSWEAADAGGYAIIAGTIQRADGVVELRIGLQCATQANGVQKRIRVNGVPRRATDLVGALGAVLFSAEDIELVFGSPQGRRRYLDVMLSQLGGHYIQALQRYQRVLTQRNHLLRNLRDGRAGEDELTFWNDSLCTEGAEVLGARFDALRRLVPLVAESFERLEGRGRLIAEYQATVAFDMRPTPASMAEALEKTKSQERAMAMTVVGPHRDDLRLSLGGVEMAKHASRGQARLAALAMRMAEGELLREQRGDAPLLLLDDVLSELDPTRRALVLEEAARYPQSLVSTADLGQLPPAYDSGVRRLRVEAGEILEEAVA